MNVSKTYMWGHKSISQSGKDKCNKIHFYMEFNEQNKQTNGKETKS